MNHCMLDIECWGKKPGCALRSIGAVIFNPRGNGWTETFYANIDRQSCLDAGLRIEKETADWWDRQSLESQLFLTSDIRPLNVVVATFNAWWHNHNCTKVWCQGAGFDAPLWQAACEAVSMSVPWKYWDIFDTRTAYEIAGFDPKRVPQVGVAHHALDDCRRQVMAVQQSIASMRM